MKECGRLPDGDLQKVHERVDGLGDKANEDQVHAEKGAKCEYCNSTWGRKEGRAPRCDHESLLGRGDGHVGQGGVRDCDGWRGRMSAGGEGVKVDQDKFSSYGLVVGSVAWPGRPTYLPTHITFTPSRELDL